MTTAPKVHWLDALLRKLFNTPMPQPIVIERGITLSPDYEWSEERITALHDANRDLERTSIRWKTAFMAANAYSIRLHPNTQRALARKLTEILGAEVIVRPARRTPTQRRWEERLEADGLVPRVGRRR